MPVIFGLAALAVSGIFGISTLLHEEEKNRIPITIIAMILVISGIYAWKKIK